jgi:OPT family oligopeptide transporter
MQLQILLLLKLIIAQTIFSYFLPVLHNIPIFGRVAAWKWLWTFNLSFGYFGQGVITGHMVMLNMLAGTIVGWGILSPLAKGMGWAPGFVGDWESGSRGWTVWISLSAMLAEALVDLTWFIAQPLLQSYRARQRHPGNGRSTESEDSPQIKKDAAIFSKFNLNWLTGGLVLSIVICIPAVAIPLGQIMPAPVTLFAIVVSLPLCIMGIKAVGTTDYNPASGIAKICQLIVGRVIPHSNSNAKLINLVAGGIAESGAVQSGFMMQNLKTGYLTGSSPDTQFLGQVLGSLVGAILSSILYRLYTSVYEVPGDVFQVPSAYVWRAGAALAVGEGLPDHVPIFALFTAIIFTGFAVARIALGNSKYRRFIPMGIPFSVGKLYGSSAFVRERC